VKHVVTVDKIAAFPDCCEYLKIFKLHPTAISRLEWCWVWWSHGAFICVRKKLLTQHPRAVESARKFLPRWHKRYKAISLPNPRYWMNSRVRDYDSMSPARSKRGVCSLPGSNIQIFCTHRSVHRFKSCAEDQMIQDLIILRTRSCGTGLFTRNGWLIHFRQINVIGWRFILPLRYQLRKGISEGTALRHFYAVRKWQERESPYPWDTNCQFL